MKRSLISAVFMVLSACTTQPPLTVLSGEYWKDQALTDLMPYWTEYSQDSASGAFHTNLDSLWNTYGDQNKYPSMISRHLFSYSASYLLSGNEEDLRLASSTAEWLLANAWDTLHGGWFDVLDREGNPVEETKTTFVQVYAVTGLVMYYFVTHNSTILKYIERSNELLETRAWDQENGGYFNSMNRDWSPRDRNKSFSSEITPVSGYLLYLYLATREQRYLDQTERILDVVINRMIDDTTGWVLEDFNSGWEYLQTRHDHTEINAGHNLETAWMLYRTYLLTGKESHLETGHRLSEKILRSGVLNENGIWLSTTGRIDTMLHGAGTYWWIQAYGNMFSLCQYRVKNRKEYLDNFVEGAMLWDENFIDRKHGDTYFSVDSAGNMTDGTKAGRYKVSYHSIEQCILNYIYLNLWVDNRPAELHFRINSSQGDILYPVLIEDNNVRISRVTGLKEGSYTVAGQGILLPELNDHPLTVFLSR